MMFPGHDAGDPSGSDKGMPPGMFPGFPGMMGAPPTRQAEVTELDEEDEIPDEELEETLAERLYGLTEMFPESMRNMSSKLAGMTVSGAKWSYSKSRSLLWVMASSATILVLPVIFETERARVSEQQLQQQRELMLGPHAAAAGGRTPGAGLPGGMMPMPGPPPPAK